MSKQGCGWAVSHRLRRFAATMMTVEFPISEARPAGKPGQRVSHHNAVGSLRAQSSSHHSTIYLCHNSNVNRLTCCQSYSSKCTSSLALENDNWLLHLYFEQHSFPCILSRSSVLTMHRCEVSSKISMLWCFAERSIITRKLKRQFFSLFHTFNSCF